MKKFLWLCSVLLLTCSLLAGCSNKNLYTEEEIHELHDVIEYVEAEQWQYQWVIGNSLPSKVSEKMTTDMAFVDYLTTKHYDPDKPMIALTFDDGPKTATTSAILDILEENGAKATFFVVGENLGENTAPILKRMVSLGCQIGNHSFYHTQLTTLDSEGIMEEIGSTNDKILELSGRPCRLIRPPYGSVNDTVKETVEQPLIMWEIDTLDWESRDAEKVIPIVREQVQDGTIILMHDLYESTVEACRILIPELIKEGYQFVTVSEMAYMKGIDLDAGEKCYNMH